MRPEQEQQLWQFMGEVRSDLKSIKEGFNRLPCSANRKDIDDLQDYKNQMVGKLSIIALICGAVGWGITSAISYFLSKN